MKMNNNTPVTIKKGFYKLIVTIHTDFLSGSNSNYFFSNKVTSHGEDFFPIIQASAIKGALRIEAERHYNSGLKSHIGICRGDYVNTNYFDSEIYTLFGGREKESKILFHTAELPQSTKDLILNPRRLYNEKFGVTISRTTRTSVDQALFTETVVSQNQDTEFHSIVEVREELTEKESEILRSAISTLEFLCSGKTRGLGHVTLDWKPIDNELTINTIKKKSSTITLKCILTLNNPSGYRLGKLKQDGYFYETISWIPGSTIRGAIANQIKSMNPTIAQKLLLNRQLKSSFFYPISIDKHSSITNVDTPKPIPKTMKQCKKNPGWVSDDLHHGYQSVLIPEIKALLRGNYENESKCLKCSERLISVPGYYTQKGISIYNRKIQTRIAIDRYLNSAREGALFSYESIIPKDSKSSLMYIGEIEISNLDDTTLECINKIQKLNVGGKTSVGYGDFKCNFVETLNQKKNNIDMISKRIEQFNQLLEHSENEKIFFFLTLTSPLSTGYETVETVLSSALKFECERVYQYADTSYYGGWNRFVGIDRNLEIAFNPGSVFIFSTHKTIGELAEKLSNLQQKGIGQKTFEGFGTFDICDEIQMEVQNA